MARPRKFDQDKVLDAIKGVFWKNGYEGTSYSDLIQSSGLHKGSLYAAFGDKKALYLRALKNYHKYEVQGAIDMLAGKDDTAHLSGVERILALFQAIIDAVTLQKDRRGCLLCNAAMDQAPYDTEVETSVGLSIAAMQAAFETALSEKYEGATLKETASSANAVYMGMRLMVRSGVSAEMLKQAKKGFEALVSK